MKLRVLQGKRARLDIQTALVKFVSDVVQDTLSARCEHVALPRVGLLTRGPE